MSLVALYDALKEAKVSDQKAAAAVEAVEARHDEQRLRRIEERIGELQNDITELRNDMEKNIAELRSDMEKNIAELRSDMEKRFAEIEGRITLLTWMGGVIIALLAMILVQIMFQ